VALRVNDVEESIDWYESYTPLRVLKWFSDDYGVGVWLAGPADVACPFVLVLSQFSLEKDPFGYAPPTVLGPFAHFGFELTDRESVDEIAARAQAEGIVTYPETQMASPIGCICLAEDPDGNTIEFSDDQGTYTNWDEEWGVSRERTPPLRPAGAIDALRDEA